MREFKFRVWDEQEKVMLTGEEMEAQTNLTTGLSCGRLFVAKTPDLRELKVMQYTGFTDTKGREIYEGDIVRLTNANGFTCLALVVFEDGCFDVVFQEPMAVRKGMKHYYRERDVLKVWVANHAAEVIGNKYENSF